MMLRLILFFMYVFPIPFIGIPTIRTTPIIATILLVVGIILWSIQSYLISKFITNPKKMAKKHQRVRDTGKITQAEILDSQNIGIQDGYPLKNLLIRFTNLAANPVKAIIQLIDSKEHEKRFEPGKTIDLKLNQRGSDPAFTFGEGEFITESRPWAWAWLIFNIVYMIVFFLVTYYFKNEGYGWRFLNPFTSWLWAPIAGISILKYLLKSGIEQDIISQYHEISSSNSKKDIGELLLYGRSTEGEIVSYGQTGLYVNEQPQLRFNMKFIDDIGNTVNKSFKKVIPLTKLHELKLGKVEVLYLPRNTDIFMISFVD
ncbi:hypothetical protein [uncultured Helcococcus sp.]|uniref:hypothetical protein n=1 Tax=uncultured Helcococcus sp. TaxID=1072508 RepID=UPI002623FE63|nr:hypothetical protein [uncultured Helcococcus sp.]